MRALYIAVFISSASFISYGVICLFSNGMKAEFERFGIQKLRLLTGFLEVLGGLGLLVGLSLPPLLPLAAGALGLLMAIGLVIRYRAHDRWIELTPAIFFLFLNVTICLVSLQKFL